MEELGTGQYICNINVCAVQLHVHVHVVVVHVCSTLTIMCSLQEMLVKILQRLTEVKVHM